MPRILDGAAIAAAIKQEVAEEVRALAAQRHSTGAGGGAGGPCAGVGDLRAQQGAGLRRAWALQRPDYAARRQSPPKRCSTLVAQLNARDDIDGILIQLPLPAQVDAKALLDAVDPAKDVDGFHPVNAGRLLAGRPALAPCTPAGVIEILKRSDIPIAGQHAVVVGRSDIVGKPVAMLLLHQNATVTICHSKTRDLPAITRQADILVAAIGRPGFITPEMVQARRDAHRCGHQPHDHARGVRPLLQRQRKARSRICQARIDRCRRHRSQGLRACRRLHACARRRGPADHCDVDGEHGARGPHEAWTAGRECSPCSALASPAAWAAARALSPRCCANWARR